MAAETEAEAVRMEQPPVSPQVVGNAFVQQYYHILHQSPELVYRFYQDVSKLGRPEEDGTMSITTTMLAINEKILSLNYADITVEIKTVDAQESFNGGVSVLVTGCLTGQDTTVRNFTQSFFLAPQDKGFFVLNDMFRYVKVSHQDDRSHIPMADTMDTVPIEQNQFPPHENLISDESTPSAEGDEVNGGEVFNPPEDQNVPVIEEEEPVAEVVNELQEVSATVVEPMPVTINEAVPKKSYAKIVIELKESAATFSPPPAPVNRNSAVKHTEKMHQLPAPAVVLDNSASVDNPNNQEGEAEGYSIYIRGLPMNANKAMLEEVFKKFGLIKDEGIQVRSHRQQGFCFGFVEFEEANAVQKAIEASPIAIGGRQAVVEEKRSTGSRGNNRRFLPGRGSMYRSEGARGRGGYGGGGGRGYSRGEFSSGRNEYNNNRNGGGGGGGNRGGSSNRGNDGYYWSDHAGNNYGGGRVNRDGGEGMPYGNAKNMAPRVPATA